ncbi:MAG: glutamine synthetase III, partial [Atopobiaceae bacterium]|nr:glutamine synthetase III [Atopobiaceae bacterium]
MSNHVSEIYGSLIFSDAVMQQRLPRPTYKELQRVIHEGERLNIDIANEVAHAMKEWAIENGATHFTHWFQPLNGITSEKHTSFVDPQSDGTTLMSFSGKELYQGEADASSFPSGGLRDTYEARGYTAWDPLSPAFIKDDVLCIPTAFISYTREALDKKTPLLRSLNAVNEQAKRVLALFGKDVKHVEANIGPEQEFFLIKLDDYKARPDLIFCGRTLFGCEPAKGQELDEHYYGAIRPEVSGFLKRIDDELWKLAIPVKAKHNEVAPCQHEIAPVYQTAVRAIDGNLVTMELLRRYAPEFGLACLEHEKPFRYVNGSGKHNNWSISAEGENLLDPGSSPESNLQFLVILSCIIAAVDEHAALLRASIASAGNDHRLGANEAPPALISMFLGDELGGVIQAVDDNQDLLRISIASAGNDHRLGGNEAPPAIISVFLGDALTPVVEAFINKEHAAASEAERMDLGVPQLPSVLRDNTDRNRTSPFAFTGNKFEFRMPGSQQNLSDPNVIINTAVAEQCERFVDYVAARSDEPLSTVALRFVRHTVRDHQRIIVDG